MISRPRMAAPRPKPRLYLITPPIAEPSVFSRQLEPALESGDVAAILLRLAQSDERTLINRAKTIAPSVQNRDVALLLDGRFDLVARAGADGTHVSGATAFSEAVEQLKPERIVGAGALASRHDAMLAAERGADYVMFGEPDTGGKCPGFAAVLERVAWWAEVFEIPCVGYAPAIENIAPLVSAGADFVALGDAVWNSDDIADKIREAEKQLQLPEPAT